MWKESEWHLAHVGGVDGSGAVRLNLQSYDGVIDENDRGVGRQPGSGFYSVPDVAIWVCVLLLKLALDVLVCLLLVTTAWC